MDYWDGSDLRCELFSGLGQVDHSEWASCLNDRKCTLLGDDYSSPRSYQRVVTRCRGSHAYAGWATFIALGLLGVK